MARYLRAIELVGGISRRRVILIMPKNRFIHELKKLLRQRGKVPTVQMEYAQVEEKVMCQMYPITKPYEEVRSPKRRDLKSYIGDPAFHMIAESR